ncbi:citryl-CoA lyase [Aquincola sp. S2]|uniref:Citryl-CoA lyase n=1 Tax=Pseudaquabacterium terrae TaxID=2732868 RepID=A0ABX2EN60_9BURK|nr:citryl-CoA lyase [Aquabacterium terrae]NRF70003.1 citryl-CoA lyase [Aquabacterium terrae]
MSAPVTPVRTRIWQEEAEADNAFATRTAHCHGYDVYGQMLGHARWVEMLYLLFRGEAPDAAQAALLEALAVGLANAGPRDPAVHAAMCAGIGGSPAAAALMAALAVGAGQHTGAREVLLAMEAWQACGTDLAAWRRHLQRPATTSTDIWPDHSEPPGFDPHGTSVAGTVRQALHRMTELSPGTSLAWLGAQRVELERCAGGPLAMTGVAAAALTDLGFSPEAGEMLFLLMRLPGAAAHALEQRSNSYRDFPFFAVELQDDPGRSKTAARAEQ